ncbi:MAG: hypothetical protein HY652_04875 [Acidobacteria bacterium]|nr:hypothetical protein [Acidobacteriota bacterium]
MEKLKLTKPQEATGEVAEVYQEIVKVRGQRGLVPVWGFFGRDPDVLRSMWTLIKRLKHQDTATPKEVLIGIALVGAQRVGCARCVTTHETELVEVEGLPREWVECLRTYEESHREGKISEKVYVGLSFGEKVAFGKELAPEEWERLNRFYTPEQIFEMAMIALVESCLARYGFVLAQFDESTEWPRDYTWSDKYREVWTR